VSLVLWLAAGPLGSAHAQTAAELVEQARQWDPGYAASAAVDRQKALQLYEKALTAQPDPAQRLDCLFRMAQLHGCIFDRRKGEQPDLHKAIGLYQQIVEAYSSDEPQVVTAMGLISDHYMTLRQFDAALLWANRTVDYDTAKAQQRLQEIYRREASLAGTTYSPEERRAIMEQAVRSGPLRENLQRMETRRVAAVDRVARAALQLDPVRAYGELRAIADRYAGTPVGDRATERLQEIMDRQADLWAPNLTLPQGSASTLQSEGQTPLLLPPDQQGMDMSPGAGSPADTGRQAPPPNTSTRPKRPTPLAESPRAPPWVRWFVCLSLAAGLALVAGLAARRTRGKTL
jgi:tetratricopeptide (TPR) repeat protein